MNAATTEVSLATPSRAEEARPVWESLAQRTANVFSTCEWGEVWWRHFGADRRRELVVVQRGDAPVAVLPMYESRLRGMRVLRFIGSGVGDELGPVCDPADRPDAVRGLMDVLGTRVLLAERMPSDYDWAEALAGRLVHREPSPIIDLAAEQDWDAYLANRSANFRQQVRGRARKLERGEGVTFRLSREPSRLQADLDALFALHAARWGDQSVTFTGGSQAFHREFAAAALERGWLRLWIAGVDEVPVAAWYGFRFAGAESFYQSGRDPAWDRSRVGAGLLEHTIRMAFEDGMREYRLLRGDEQYKQRYAGQDAAVCTVACARRPVGRAAVTALDALVRSRMGRRLLGSPTT